VGIGAGLAGPLREDNEFVGIKLRVAYDINDDMRIVSLTGYQDLKRRALFDWSGAPYEILLQKASGDIESISEELRIEGGNDRMNWLVGGYVARDEIIDAIDRIPLAGGLSAVGNIGDGTLDRLSLNIVVPTDKLGIKGGRFTFKNDWNETHVTDPTSGEDRPITQVRPTQANIGFQQDIVSWKTQWGINWLPLLGQGTYDVDQTSVWRGSRYYEAFAEHKPTPTLAIRAQLNLWDDFTQSRTVFADRDTRAVAFVEDSVVDPRTFASIRVRKTF